MDESQEISLPFCQPDGPPSTNQARRRTFENNHRQYARCPITEEGTTAILSMNGHRFNCRLVELSIGGFGVVVPGPLQLNSGTVGRLRTRGLNYIVSVTRLEPRTEGVFIGLKQLEEVLDHQQHLPGEVSPIFGYLVAGISGSLIAAFSYFCIYGN